MKLCALALAVALPSLLWMPTMSMAKDTTNLSAQISSLQAQLDALKTQLPAQQRAHRNIKKRRSKQIESANAAKHVAAQPAAQTKIPPETEQSQSSNSAERGDFFRMMRKENYLPFDLDVPGQAFVSTGPYVGVRIQYSGSYLVINSPSVNTDLQLLSIRKSINEQLHLLNNNDAKQPHHSHLLLSGLIEGQANYANLGGQPSKTNLDLSGATLDAFIVGPSDWLLGFLEMSYDNGLPASGNFTVNNSKVYVNKAFVTVGNFEVSPFYSSFGQYYVPFGTFSSTNVSDTLPKYIGRTKARALTLGAMQQSKNAFYGALYVFRGDSHAASVSKINNGGFNLGYKFDAGSISGNVGVGMIANIADAVGMQSNVGFQNNEQIHHRVPALNIRGIFTLGDHVNLIGEYIGATTRFNSSDMSYNGRGAKPSALDMQAAYSFYILGDKPSSIGIGYGKSDQGLALNMPLTRTAVTFTTSLYRNTLQSIEFRRDQNYAASDRANGPTVSGTACSAASCAGTGKSDNVVTAQFDYYF